MQFLLGLFFLFHGLIHSAYLAQKPNDPSYPFDFSKGWFYDAVGHSSAVATGATLAAITIGAFCLAALGAWGMSAFDTLARPAVIVGAISSLLLLVLFWQNWLIAGVVIDLVLLYGIFVLGWTFR